MMSTYHRAVTIVKRNQVRLLGATKNTLIFKVKQRTGEFTEVYYTQLGGWSCNAKGGDFGCIMYVGPRSLPYCSHSKACLMWLLKKKYLKTVGDLKKVDLLGMVKFED